MPVAHIATVTPISQTVGANRIIKAKAIPHPLGDPTLAPADEKAMRRKMVEKALAALTTEIAEQTLF